MLAEEVASAASLQMNLDYRFEGCVEAESIFAAAHAAVEAAGTAPAREFRMAMDPSHRVMILSIPAVLK